MINFKYEIEFNYLWIVFYLQCRVWDINKVIRNRSSAQTNQNKQFCKLVARCVIHTL